MESDKFFAGLFDWDFKQFIALRFIKVIYVIGAVFIGLIALGVIFTGFAQGGSRIVTGLVAGLIGGLLYLIFFRVWLEVIAMLFRIGQNTDRMATALAGNTPPPPPPSPGDAMPPGPVS